MDILKRQHQRRCTTRRNGVPKPAVLEGSVDGACTKSDYVRLRAHACPYNPFANTHGATAGGPFAYMMAPLLFASLYRNQDAPHRMRFTRVPSPFCRPSSGRPNKYRPDRMCATWQIMHSIFRIIRARAHVFRILQERANAPERECILLLPRDLNASEINWLSV